MAIDRSRYKRAYLLLEELEADPVSVLRKASEIYQMATKGFPEDTISPATGEVVTLNRIQPAVGIQALQVINATTKRIHEELVLDDAANADQDEDNGVMISISNLTVNRDAF